MTASTLWEVLDQAQDTVVALRAQSMTVELAFQWGFKPTSLADSF